VAAFAHGSSWRVLAWLGLVAVVLAIVTVRFAASAWCPVIGAAVEHLPERAEIRDGRLIWPDLQVVTLAANSALSLRVNPREVVAFGQSADVQIALRPSSVDISSLLGFIAFPYPPLWSAPLDRPTLEPLWGAWRPHLLAILGTLAALGLLLLWTLLAAVMMTPLRLYSAMARRDVSLGGCWRLGAVALMPGALVMGLGIILYSLQRIALPELLLINALHLVVGLVYLAVAPLRLPPRPKAVSTSPFTPPPPPEPAEPTAANPVSPPITGGNPFGTSDQDKA
jgi:hypothetical protein